MKNKRNIFIIAIITISIMISVNIEKNNSQKNVIATNTITKENDTVDDTVDEEDSNIFLLPDSVTEITSQGYYEDIIRLSDNYRNSDKVLYDEQIIYPRGMVIGLVLEKANKKKFIEHKTDVTDIINIIEGSLINTSKVSKSEDEILRAKLLILNAKAQYILTIITYIGNNQFDLDINYPEELVKNDNKTVVIESIDLLNKLQNIDV